MSTPLKSKEDLQEDLTKALDRNLEVMIQNAKIGLDRDQWKAIAGELYNTLELCSIYTSTDPHQALRQLMGNSRIANETLTKYNKLIKP